jgi:lysophospholipase L1-like esterase
MFLAATLIGLTLAQQSSPKPLEFRDGDRIVWIGNTLVEREQRYGYWEAALLGANADKKMTFRNLGWSGDTVFGDARNGFDASPKGFERLVGLTLELAPTVIFVSYGTNESFEGKDGLEKFEKGLEKLLDALAPTKARIVLFTPLPFEQNKSLPDPAVRNESLHLYADAIRRIATKRQVALADLLAESASIYEAPRKVPLTENGMHLGRLGYYALSGAFIRSLKFTPTSGGGAFLELSKAVAEKNQLFFYRWRPQNETYLFGFRKHEQGRNAKEVAEFDPLVHKSEEKIEQILKSFPRK